MQVDKKTIEQINKEIQRCVERNTKIENGNYILAMLLKDIRDEKVKDVYEVAKWCFEMMKTNNISAKN